MKKRLSIILTILSILVLASGCSAGEKPDKVVSEFIEAMKEFDFELMSTKINPEARGEMDEIEDIYGEDGSLENYFIEYVEGNAKKITYTINESEVDENKAKVNVSFEYVDGAPLFKATFAEYMKEIFALAFSNMDEEITDEQYSEIFIKSMEEQSELIEETFTEKTLDVECMKIEDEWYINEPSDEILDVLMSNMMSTMDELDNFDDEGTEIDEEDVNLIEKNIGDEIELKTLKIKVTSVEETDILTSEYGEDILAKEDTKFVLVDMEVTNITNSELVFPDDFMLIDNEEREFRTYSDSIGAVDNYLNYRDLPPSIKEEGQLIYEVPKDSLNYYTIMGKADTNDVYKIILN